MKKIVTVVLISMSLTGCLTTATGTREGIIVKSAKEGVICPTYEAELIKGGMSNGSGGFGVKPFDFTIENSDLLPIVQKAVDEQKEVRVTYHTEFATFCRSETQDNVFLDSIQIIN